MEAGKLFITPEMPVREAIRQLDQTAKKLLVVVEANKALWCDYRRGYQKVHD